MTKQRKCLIIMVLFSLMLPRFAPAATINYTYDAQHRLVQASYSDSQKEFYNYDAAGNVDQHVVITDVKYLESWLLYFSMLEPWTPPELAAILRHALMLPTTLTPYAIPKV